MMKRSVVWSVAVLAWGALAVRSQEDRKWYLNYLDGIDQIQKGDYTKAIGFIEMAIKQEGKPRANTRYVGNQRGPYIPYYYLGVAYFNLGRMEVAKYNFEKSLQAGAVVGLPEKKELDRYMAEIDLKVAQKTPVAPPPVKTAGSASGDVQAARDLQRAQDLSDQGKTAEARAVLERLKGAGGQYADLADQQIRKLQAAEAAVREAESMARQAEELYRKGDYSGALNKYREVLKKRPDSPGALDAVDRCGRAVRLAKELADAEGLASADPARAEEALSRIRAEDPAFPGLGALAERVAQEKRRREQTNREAALDGYVRDGRAALQSGDGELAKRRFLDALNMSPPQERQAEIRKLLAEAEARVRQAGEAGALLARGKAAAQKGDKAAARESFRAVLALDPKHAEAKRMMAVLDGAGDTPLEVVYRKMLKSGIRAYFLSGYDEAAASLRSYMELTPENGDLARFFLGAALVSRYLAEPGTPKSVLDEGLDALSRVRRAGVLRLADAFRRMISPVIWNAYQKGAI